MNKSLDCRIEKSVLRWHNHAERINVTRVEKRYMSDYDGQRRKGGIRKRWHDILNDCVNIRRSRIGEVRVFVYDK